MADFVNAGRPVPAAGRGAFPSSLSVGPAALVRQYGRNAAWPIVGPVEWCGRCRARDGLEALANGRARVGVGSLYRSCGEGARTPRPARLKEGQGEAGLRCPSFDGRCSLAAPRPPSCSVNCVCGWRWVGRWRGSAGLGRVALGGWKFIWAVFGGNAGVLGRCPTFDQPKV